MKIIKEDKKAQSLALVFLKKGGIVIGRTDTVYGFLADAQNKKAVLKIFKIKKRSKKKPISVFVKDFNMANKIGIIDKPQAKVLRTFWPGKVTAILKRRAGIKMYGIKKDTVAVRIPKYPFLNALLKKINKPLAQTSVNISNRLALNDIGDIVVQFRKLDILIIDGGDIKKAKPSKIIDITGKTIKTLRA